MPRARTLGMRCRQGGRRRSQRADTLDNVQQESPRSSSSGPTDRDHAPAVPTIIDLSVNSDSLSQATATRSSAALSRAADTTLPATSPPLRRTYSSDRSIISKTSEEEEDDDEDTISSSSQAGDELIANKISRQLNLSDSPKLSKSEKQRQKRLMQQMTSKQLIGTFRQYSPDHRRAIKQLEMGSVVRYGNKKQTYTIKNIYIDAAEKKLEVWGLQEGKKDNVNERLEVEMILLKRSKRGEKRSRSDMSEADNVQESDRIARKEKEKCRKIQWGLKKAEKKAKKKLKILQFPKDVKCFICQIEDKTEGYIGNVGTCLQQHNNEPSLCVDCVHKDIMIHKLEYVLCHRCHPPCKLF